MNRFLGTLIIVLAALCIASVLIFHLTTPIAVLLFLIAGMVVFLAKFLELSAKETYRH